MNRTASAGRGCPARITGERPRKTRRRCRGPGPFDTSMSDLNGGACRGRNPPRRSLYSPPLLFETDG